MPRAQADAQADELLGQFGLADKRDEYPDRLSGGQQQRVAIVRALAMRPSLMLLDEVTSALDPELVGEVLNTIRELAVGGMTMLIATHEMSFAREIADHVCFIDAGLILEQGPPEKIFTAPSEPRTQQFLQPLFADPELHPQWLRSLHVLNALFIFALGYHLAQRGTKTVRGMPGAA